MNDFKNNQINNNIDKIRIGSCLELDFLFDNFQSDFLRLSKFINNNSFLLNNQIEDTLLSNFDELKSILYGIFDMVLSDIDKNSDFCKFSLRYY